MTHAALRTLMPLAGWPEERANTVEVTGGTDPILPTPFRIGETSAATLGAVGLAVSDLWKLRTGRSQDVAVDARRATASFAAVTTCTWTMRQSRMSATPSWASTLRSMAASVTSTATSRITAPPPSACSVSRRIGRQYARPSCAGMPSNSRRRSSPPVAPGGMARSMDEWAQHPQAAAIAALPLMEIVARSVIARPSRFQMATGRSPASGCSI